MGIDSPLLLFMMECNPAAVKIVDTDQSRRTVLHEACCGQASLDVAIYRRLVDLWPAACLRLEEYGKSPYDEALHNTQNNVEVDFMLAATHEAACVLMEVILTAAATTSMDNKESSRQRRQRKRFYSGKQY